MKRLTVLITLVAIMVAYKVQAKEWQVITSFPGRPATGSYSGTGAGTWYGLMDFDGDGVQEMSLTLDGKGNDISPEELVIVNGADQTQQWVVTLPDGTILIGFMNFDGTVGSNGAVKEVLFAEKVGGRYINPVVLYNVDATAGIYEVRIWDSGTILIGGWDLNDDGIFELVIDDPNKNEVQVWGLQ